MNKQSKELTEFYKEYADWAKQGKKSKVLKCHLGLCSNLALFLDSKNYNHDVYEEMRSQLMQSFPGNYLYPFGGEHRYSMDRLREEMHKNEERLSWVLSHLEGK